MCHLALRIARFRLLSALSVACHYASLSSQNCPFRPSQCLVSTLSLRVTTTAQWASLRAKRRLSLRFMVLKNRSDKCHFALSIAHFSIVVTRSDNVVTRPLYDWKLMICHTEPGFFLEKEENAFFFF